MTVTNVGEQWINWCAKILNVRFLTRLLQRFFSKFFVQKVEAVRAATSAADAPVFTPCPKPCSFESFKPISPEQVLFLIGRAQSKTSELDPVPTWLVKECAVILAPLFAYVFNDSLQKGHRSPEQKRAIIYPGLKKPSLNPDDLTNTIGLSRILVLFQSC